MVLFPYILEKKSIGKVVEKAVKINANKVPNWDINNNGFLPNLSLNLPKRIPKTKPNIALTEKTKPITGVVVWNNLLKKPTMEKSKEKPSISIKTDIQSGAILGYLNNFLCLLSVISSTLEVDIRNSKCQEQWSLNCKDQS